MSNPNTMEEANNATRELFENEMYTDEPTAEPVNTEPLIENEEVLSENQSGATDETVQTDETAQVQDQQVQNQSELKAAETAELAAQVASQKNEQLEQALREIEALKEQNEEMKGTIEEISRRNEENIINEALTPPTLDINGLAFADEETQKSELSKFAEQLSEYNRRQILEELSPAIEYAKKGMREAEKNDTVNALSQLPELNRAGFKEMLPQLDEIITKNKWLAAADMPLEEKYINAIAFAKGMDLLTKPPETEAVKKAPELSELMEEYNKNPEFREMVEKQRIEQIKQNQQVPMFSASTGAANAAITIKDKPKTFEEASERTREMFSGM